MRVLSKMLLATVALAAGAGTAAAADLYVPPPSAPIMAPAASNWDGPYIGANIGYSWGKADHTSGPGTNDITLSGFMIGAQLGYNFHVSDNIVLGIEGSADWSNETGSIPAFGTTTHTINYDGMLVGRLGVDMGNFMPYVDAGVAFANATRANGGPVSTTNTQTGWTVGAGVEVMLADHLSAFVSYNYADYGSAVYDTGGIPPTIHLTDNIFKAGLNYHF